MKIFIDTASLEEINYWNDRIVLDGVTTNQKIFLAEKGVNFKERVMAICDTIKDDVSIELTEKSVHGMIKEAEKYSTWADNIVIKVPMTVNGDGLGVVRSLALENIKTNATCMMTADQLILAAQAGADYVSLFYNRSKDSGLDPDKELEKASLVIGDCQIIVGSIRNVDDMSNALFAGADVVTMPPKILKEILNNKKTKETIKEFDDAWKEFKK